MMISSVAEWFQTPLLQLPGPVFKFLRHIVALLNKATYHAYLCLVEFKQAANYTGEISSELSNLENS